MTEQLDGFAAMILTHGRPDRVLTYGTLRRCGYTGRIVIVIDDEDPAGDRYRQLYGNEVEVFSKAEVAEMIDEGDNLRDRRAVVYARNAAFDIAKRIGVRYFVQLDDDYTGFHLRFDKAGRYCQRPVRDLDAVFEAFVRYLQRTPFAAITMAQNGDIVGGKASTNVTAIRAKRKAMNSFFCDVQRRFFFHGRLNEDVNVYTAQQRAGLPFLMVYAATLRQLATQQAPGGMTDLYKALGTHVKTFYSVMMAPSCVREYAMGLQHKRIHHKVDYDACAPKIIREHYRKAGGTA